MKLASGIRKHGFRKWYERELLSSHAHMVLTFVCAVGLLAAFEGSAQGRDGADLLGIGLCAATGIWALRRYLYLLTHAESVAHQADCPGCGSYARFDLVSADASGDEVAVRCRLCRREWTISA